MAAVYNGTDFDELPHILDFSFTEEDSVPTTITTSTNGAAKSGCGTTERTGTITYACHDGDEPPLSSGESMFIRWYQNRLDPTTFEEATITRTQQTQEFDLNSEEVPTKGLEVNVGADYKKFKNGVLIDGKGFTGNGYVIPVDPPVALPINPTEDPPVVP